MEDSAKEPISEGESQESTFITETKIDYKINNNISITYY